MGLTKHQKDIADQTIRSIRLSTPDRRYTCLSGIGGTGKTFTTNYIAEQFEEDGYSIAITSTTHQACSVLQEEMALSGFDVKTINSYLLMKPLKDSATLELATSKWDYQKIENVDVLVIDEFSMLTKEVIFTINAYADAFNKDLKILLVGDATQLIMQPDTIDELHIEDNTFYLMEPMRAKKGSGIAEYAVAASKAIRANIAPPWDIFNGIDIIKYNDHAKFIRAWKNSSFDLQPEDIKILCFTNATVRTYNKHIKKDYYGQTSEYAQGNMIVIRNPVTLQDDKKMNDKYETRIPNNKRLKIKKVESTIMEIEGAEENELGYKIYPEGYQGFFIVPKTKIGLKRFLQPFVNKKDWGNYYHNKDRFCVAHHAESGTVHSSQGSSFDEVFIDGTDIMKAMEHTNRLAYVAITRARKKAHIFVGKDRKWDTFKPESRPLLNKKSKRDNDE